MRHTRYWRLATTIFVASAIWFAGCTFHINVFPGVKTDVRWPASQPMETSKCIQTETE